MKPDLLSQRCALSCLCLLALSLFSVTGCNSGKDGSDVMAKVDGRKIFRADVDKYYLNQTSGSDQQPSGEQATSLRLSILNELVETEILMRRAEKLGLLATDEVQFCYEIAGPHDFVALFDCANMAEFNSAADALLASSPTVRRYETHFVKREVKFAPFVELGA